MPARAPRKDTAPLPEWTYCATPEAEGEVGGVWPWLRQGWTFLDGLTEEERTQVVDDLQDVRRHLSPSRFPMLDAEGGLKLAALFHLSPQQEPLIQSPVALDTD